MAMRMCSFASSSICDSRSWGTWLGSICGDTSCGTAIGGGTDILTGSLRDDAISGNAGCSNVGNGRDTGTCEGFEDSAEDSSGDDEDRDDERIRFGDVSVSFSSSRSRFLLMPLLTVDESMLLPFFVSAVKETPTGWFSVIGI